MRDIIKSMYIMCAGDESVGIPDNHTTIQSDDCLIDLSVFTKEDRQPVLDEIKIHFRDAFSLIYDGEVKVYYDFEFDELFRDNE